MSGETERSQSAWTTDTLKEYFDQRFLDQKEAVNAALAAAERAVEKAELNAEKWRQNANEWRGAMNDRERNLMPRAEAEKSIAANAEKIDALQARIDRNDGRTSGLMMLFVIIAALGTLVSVVIAIKR